MVKKLFAGIFIVTFGFVFVFSNVASVKGQESNTDEFTLEEITVTAQKREENQQKVAIAMEVVSGEELRELGRNDVSEILNNISSLIINKGTEGFRVSLRSISDDLGETFGMAASTPIVGMNTDGVFSNRKITGRGLYDIERVEVLFGPQSTLYATTSPGGMVNIVTANPKTDRYEASGTLEYGNYNLLHTEGSMNAPISDTMALRAAFSTSVHDGYLTNGSDDEDSKSARIKALFSPNDRLSFVITGEYEKTGGGGFANVEIFEDQDDVDNPWTAVNYDPDPERIQTNKKIFANIDWDMGFGALTIVPAYTKKLYNRTSTDDLGVTTDSEEKGYEKGLEMRLASSEGSFIKWIAGLNWYDSKIESNSVGDDGSFNYQSNTQNIKAAYGNITYPVTDQFRVTGGLRYSKDSNDTFSRQYPARPGMETDSSGAGIEPVYMSYSDPNYKLGIEYDLAENSMLYSDYSTSYRTQKGADEFGDAFPPEFLKAITIGSKNRFLENKLQVNASAYFYKYENYMVQGIVRSIFRKDINGDGDYDDENLWDEDYQDYRNETITGAMDENGRNIGDVDVMGVDIQTNWIITSKDKLDFSVSYLHTEFTKMYLDFWDSTNEMGITDQDYKGKGKTNSPAWTINASYDHNFILWNEGTLTTRIDARYQSEYFLCYNERTLSFDSDWNPVITDITGKRVQEAHHITNLSATYANPDGNWTLSGYVKNLENYAVKTNFMSIGPGSLVIGAPRTYGGVLTVNF